MRDFFRGQFDYIYFFYGLSFLFLALICFSIDRKKTRPLPWLLLGLFGLVHGINEWMDLATVVYGQNRLFLLLQPFVLGVSFLMLFEFALVGYVRIVGKTLARRWVYLLLFVMVGIGAKSGNNGLAVGIRYFLGFPAALLSSFVVFRAARTERNDRWPLYTLSMAFLLYAVFSGLIVPKADFLLAQKINLESFYRDFDLPAQLVRGIIALSAVMAVWFYSSVLYDISYKPFRHRVNFKLTKWVIISTMVFLIGAGWLFTNFFDYYSSVQVIKNNKPNSPLNTLVKELTTLENAAKSLSRASAIKPVLSGADTERATEVLDNFTKRFNMKNCFVLDAKGVVLAYAGEKIGEKGQGKTQLPAAYFKEALSGNAGYYFVSGSNYNERDYYISYPLKDSNGKVNGIVLVSKLISVKPMFQYRLLSILITLFVCILAISLFIALRKRETLIEFIDKTNAQLQEIDRLKTDFISITSHELRTPLTSIKNATTILLKGKLIKEEVNPQEKELIEIILKNTDRQMRMIGDLLDISKIEAGVLTVSPEKVDITALIVETIANLQPQAKEKNIELKFFNAPGVNTVLIDPDHTRRILINLLTNAIKFTAAGGQITVRAEKREKETLISVSDTGIGIPKEETGKLFNKFYRSQDPATRQTGGTGLGLVIAKGLVEAQGGRIWLKSLIGKGSTFYFTLPGS